MRKKLLTTLFLLGSLLSLAEGNLTIHDLKMRMELDKSKPNHVVVNIIPDDTEERIEAILSQSNTITIDKSNLLPKKAQEKKVKVENTTKKPKEIIKEKLKEPEVQKVEETKVEEVVEKLEIPEIIEQNIEEKIEKQEIKLEPREEIIEPLFKENNEIKEEKISLGVIVSIGVIIVGIVSILYKKIRK